VKKEQQGFHCTIQDRFLLHLLDYRNHFHDVEVPIQLTQEGTADIININRKHIPRVAQRLLDKELILSEKRHITGKKQRLLSYFLTEKGIEQARALHDHFIKQTIRYMDKRRKLHSVTIEWILQNHKKTYSLAEILSQINQTMIFDSTFEKKKQPDPISQSINKDAAIHIYQKALEQAWKDDSMSTDERELLSNLRKTLNISYKQHMELEKKVIKKTNNTPDPQIQQLYITAVKEALKDKKITNDEKAILNHIRSLLKETEQQ
jgi:hypothetical protein